VAATASFVGQPVQDVPTQGIPNLYPGNPGHGTHCIGLACGPQAPTGPSQYGRYGAAYGAQIYVGKVLANQGVSVQGSVLQGIQWAVQQGCHIVSMSLSGPPQFGDPYQTVAEQAIQHGTVLIAAVGNDSNRPGSGFHDDKPLKEAPVGSPANSLRILGVGAVDENLQVTSFSNRGSYGTAAGVDLVAPGWQVYSSLPGPTTYGMLAGTSMATPLVAGIAALLKEARPNFTALDILRTLVRMTQQVPGGDPDLVGAGLVQCP